MVDKDKSYWDVLDANRPITYGKPVWDLVWEVNSKLPLEDPWPFDIKAKINDKAFHYLSDNFLTKVPFFTPDEIKLIEENREKAEANRLFIENDIVKFELIHPLVIGLFPFTTEKSVWRYYYQLWESTFTILEKLETAYYPDKNLKYDEFFEFLLNSVSTAITFSYDNHPELFNHDDYSKRQHFVWVNSILHALEESGAIEVKNGYLRLIAS